MNKKNSSYITAGSESKSFTGDDIKIYYTGKFQDFTARYIIKPSNLRQSITSVTKSDRVSF